MRHGSLFSGIGGFDLAAEWMGWENVFHCEWMEFPRKVLDYHFPNADSHIDICKTDFRKYANTIDVLTGGFPCQPFSLAGKRKGTDDERYLWGEMLRAIQEIKPRFVIAENVAGITSIDGGMVFQQVCLDLENEGYEVQPFIIGACSKNAPHRRDRCWFIGVRNASDNNSIVRREGREFEPGKQSRHGESNESSNTEINCNATNTKCKSEGSHGRANNETQKNLRRQNEGNVLGTLCGDGYATDTNSRRTQTRKVGKVLGQSDTQGETGGFVNDALQGNATDSGYKGLQGSEFNGTSQGRKWNGDESYGSTTKLHQVSQWSNFPTQSPLCGGDDGLPTELDGITFPKWRAESIKGYGNAIVPQIAKQLFEILESL